MDDKSKEQVKELVNKAVKADASHEALHFSQAALNAANAFAQVHNTK